MLDLIAWAILIAFAVSAFFWAIRPSKNIWTKGH